MIGKKGRGEIESAVTLIFGIMIILIFLFSGIVSDISRAFEGFGALGALLSFLFILMIVVAIWEAFNKK